MCLGLLPGSVDQHDLHRCLGQVTFQSMIFVFLVYPFLPLAHQIELPSRTYIFGVIASWALSKLWGCNYHLKILKVAFESSCRPRTKKCFCKKQQNQQPYIIRHFRDLEESHQNGRDFLRRLITQAISLSHEKLRIVLVFSTSPQGSRFKPWVSKDFARVVLLPMQGRCRLSFGGRFKRGVAYRGKFLYTWLWRAKRVWVYKELPKAPEQWEDLGEKDSPRGGG